MPQAAAIAVHEGAWVAPDLREVYDRNAQFVRALLIRLTGSQAEAEDLLQDVFVVAWLKLDRLRSTDPRAFLCGIAVHLAARARRRAGVRRFFARLLAPEAADGRTPETHLEADEANRRVQALLARLSPKKRVVFTLYELQELSGPQIAAALGCPLKTVWSRLGHARREFAALARAEVDPVMPEGRR